MGAAGFLSSVNWDVPTWDLFIGIFFVITALIYGLSLGRERVLVILVSIYMSFAVASNLPFINEEISQRFNLGPAFVMRTLVFLVLVAMLFFLFSRMGLFMASTSRTSLPLVALFSVLHVGLFITIIFSFLPPNFAANVSETTQVIFDSDMGRFLWILGPVLALYLAKQRDAIA